MISEDKAKDQPKSLNKKSTQTQTGFQVLPGLWEIARKY